MTRFARAKGSKASNERKPEEATSWSEMRKSLFIERGKEIENQLHEYVTKTDNGPNCSEWAPLGNDGYSEPLLKRGIIMKNEEGKKITMDKREGVQCKTKTVGTAEEKANVPLNGESKQKSKKPKMSPSEGSRSKVTKIKKKRQKPAGDSEEEVPPKKKKKLTLADAESMAKEKGKEAEARSGKKFRNKKTEAKPKPLMKKYIENGKSHLQGKFSEHSERKGKFHDKSFEKASSTLEELIINGEVVETVKFQGFYVTLDDAERLKKLRSEMKKEGIPRDKLEAAIKLERRRAEKALSRLKKSVCFHCRRRGHLLSNCPDLLQKATSATGICYKCGSTEHSAAQCKVARDSSYQFAECFICGEQGHIARQCPDNPRGLYPQGGACRECGDVTHLRKDCPIVLSKKEEEAVTVALRNDRNLECLDEEIVSREKRQSSGQAVKRNSAVKF